jgi:hypothetical protein
MFFLFIPKTISVLAFRKPYTVCDFIDGTAINAATFIPAAWLSHACIIQFQSLPTSLDILYHLLKKWGVK